MIAFFNLTVPLWLAIPCWAICGLGGFLMGWSRR